MKIKTMKTISGDQNPNSKASFGINERMQVA